MQRKRNAISLLLALVMLVTPMTPVFAYVDAGADAGSWYSAYADAGLGYSTYEDMGADAGYSAYADEEPATYGDLTSYMQNLMLSGASGSPRATAYPSSGLKEWNDTEGYNGVHSEWTVPLTPAYNMDWTEADAWDVGNIYHWFTSDSDKYYFKANGTSLASGGALDYTSGQRQIEIYTTTDDALEGIGYISTYMPRLAYDENAVAYLQLIDVGRGGVYAMNASIPQDAEVSQNAEIPQDAASSQNAAIPQAAGIAGASAFGPHMVWPKYVEPAYYYNGLHVELTSTPGAVANIFGESDWRLNIERGNGTYLSGINLGASDTGGDFQSLNFEPGEYTLKLTYLENNGTAVEASVLAKFMVEDYVGFIEYSINGVPAMIMQGQYSSYIELMLPDDMYMEPYEFAAEFSVADGVVVKKGGEIQESGITRNTFAESVLYTLESPRGITREVWVKVSGKVSLHYDLSGVIKYVEQNTGILLPAVNASFDLRSVYGDPVGTIVTNADGTFNIQGDWIGEPMQQELVLGAHDEYGAPAEIQGSGWIIGNSCWLYPEGYVEITYGLGGYSENYIFRGIVEDEDDGQRIVGAAAKWDGVTWATSGASGGFEFEFDNHWRWDSYGFTLIAPGYQSGYFNIRPKSTESTLSVIEKGYIDLGVIKLKKAPTAFNGVEMSVYVSPNHTQRGKQAEVWLKYKSDTALSGAQISAFVPDGVKIVEGSLTDSGATIEANGNRVILTNDLAADTEYNLGFWIYAEEDFPANYFAVNAELEGDAGLKAVGSALVTLSDITIDLPAEIGVDGANSKPFTVNGEATAIEGYTIDISVTDTNGNSYTVTPDMTGIPAEDNGPWYRVNDVVIKDVNTNLGVFLVKASLKDDGGTVVSEAVKALIVREDALELTGIHLYTNNVNVYAREPISNSSYVTASIFVNYDFSGRYDLHINTSWKKTEVLSGASIKYVMQTNLGVFEQEAATEITDDAAILKATFERGGYGAAAPYCGFSTGHIYLEIKRPDVREPLFFRVASLTFLIDPSGYVYDAVTREPISGATVTLEELTGAAIEPEAGEGGVWVKWDAEKYNQHNPQSTDVDGAYGWMVPPGKYRVLVEADGYLPYRTDESSYGIITVPPSHEDVNIGLEKLTVTAEDGSLHQGIEGRAYSAALKTNGTGELIWAVTEGSLPAGLSLDTSSGVISGTPTALGISSFKISVSDGRLTSEAKAFSIAIGERPDDGGDDDEDVSTPAALTVTTTEGALAGGYVSEAYSAALSTNGTGTLTWSVSEGSLPAGLTLGAATGVISGTPTAAGTSSFKITASDGVLTSDPKAFSIRIVNRSYSGGVGGGGGGGGSNPAPATTKEAIDTEETPGAPLPGGLRFVDVRADDWFYEDVEYVAENGIFTGTSETTFSPLLSITRGMMATVLGRLHGVDASKYTTSSFSDVSASQYYAPYVEWAKESGVVLGVGENRFEPDAGITRQDIAVMITRYAEFANKRYPETRKFNVFADSDEIGDYAKNAIDSLCNGNIINGIGENLFNPKGLATRAEVSAILHRFILAANMQGGTVAEAVSEAEAAAETTTEGAIGTGGVS